MSVPHDRLHRRPGGPGQRAARAFALVVLLVAACSPGTTQTTSGPAQGSLRVPPSSPASGPASTPGVAAATPAALASLFVTTREFASVVGAPLAMVAPRDGSGRLFVATQQGVIWVLRDGRVGPAPMLDIHARVSGGGEQGLLGIALHPGFPTDPRIFVDYTDTNGDTVVSSYRLDPADPDRLVPASQTVILTVDQPFENHNGGALQFGPDGDLYISLGDGGDAGDPFGNGQNTDTLLGKILRIDIDHPAGSKAYSVPADNPFVGKVGFRPEIWLYGLRNPWRMSFDRATGDLWIGDVGQDLWEEVDVIRAGQKGLDLGWNIREATHCFRPVEGCASEGLTPPVAEYGHGQGCTVIGGYVYRGTAQPGLTGLYLAADYCSGILWAIPATAESLVKPQVAGFVVTAMVAFAEDAAGELYLLNEAGDIYRVTAAAP